MRVAPVARPAAPYRRRKRLILWAAGITAFAIFGYDLWSPLQGAVAVLYIIVVLLVAQIGTYRGVLLTGLGCGILALIAFATDHFGDPLDSAYVRFGVSLVAIFAATLLSLRDRSARTTLAEQARILELSHDTVIIRDANDRIVYWNDGAHRLYGWAGEEAVGKHCGELLHCEFPADQVDSALEQHGHWAGELMRDRKDGTRIVLASRWLLRRDPEGNAIGLIESSADVTEKKRADAERRRSEQRYKTIFNSAGFAIWEADWTELHGHIRKRVPSGLDLAGWLANHPEVLRESRAPVYVRDVNTAAVELFDATDREALLGNSILAWMPAGSEVEFASVLAGLAGGADMVEREVRYLTLSGRPIDVLLRMRLLAGGEPWSRVLAMGLDVTERNEARSKLEQASAELAHAARVSTLGQLAASIAHEVNQPLSAIITYGKSAKRWLAKSEPDVAEVANCLDQIVSNGSRAADVITRMRALARNGQVQVETLHLCRLINESIALVEREVRQHQIAVRFSSGGEDVLVTGDRVQIQQVLVNLAINAIQAMCDVQGRLRELHISVEAEADVMMCVSVCDCGNGISGDPARIFEPFFTTKREGMGMGLSISRSIIEAQGGRIGAANNSDHGATISFTLPVAAADQPIRKGAMDTSV
ncbi:PAS domain S-box protein [Mesorhizobium sp. CCANP35]|uniref:histidine kinase n=2 Tax=Mesorhizobium neociceri TaxID=1307853 RepID=A0A838AYB3_9HYPH|nr:PAS domain S-box protein [Mesorhizobium neociceri]